MLRNESDIVALWLAHARSVFDRVYVVDHASSDGTFEYLSAVAAADDGVRLCRFNEPGYYQEEITNAVATIAALECPRAWLIPIDADEFVSLQDDRRLDTVLRELTSEHVVELWWRNMVPLCLTADVEITGTRPLLVANGLGRYSKKGMHASALTSLGYRFVQGNHQIITADQREVVRERVRGVGELRHLPVRSLAHFALKCVQGVLAYDSLPLARRKVDQGFHWRDMVASSVRAGKIDCARARAIAAFYGERSAARPAALDIDQMIDMGWSIMALTSASVAPVPRVDRREYFSGLLAALHETEDEVLRRFADIATNPAGASASRSGSVERRNVFGKLTARVLDEILCGDVTELLGLFIGPSIQYQRWPMSSAWTSHVPFLFSLLTWLEPRRFVELGTHHGNSFFAACQIAAEMPRQMECVAIDSWTGDEHAGSYSEEVFQNFKYVLSQNFQGFANFLRSDFSIANTSFELQSIDLLHIDGLHTYEAVKNDFVTWLPKMSTEGVILFHDTQVRERGFGVWRLWEEEAQKFPSFEFLHGHGLGVLFTGERLSARAEQLMKLLRDPSNAEFMRAYFSRLGGLFPLTRPRDR